MNINKQALTRNLSKKLLTAKRNSPHFFFVGGVIGIVGSGILACRATLQLEDRLDAIRSDLDAVKKIEENPNVDASAKYLLYVSGKSFVSIGRLYAPAIIVGTVSVIALTGSHVQLTRRNAALSATLALVSKAYDDYRVRVQQEIGEERELDIYRAIENKEVTVDGKKQIVKVSDPLGRSPYSRIFDECSRYWQPNAELNRIFLEVQQNYFNTRLVAKGYLFLNDVYDDLGFDKTQAGQLVGWIYKGDGDGYVDLGMYEVYNERFINGNERNVILDFNVDGPIHNKINESTY